MKDPYIKIGHFKRPESDSTISGASMLRGHLTEYKAPPQPRKPKPVQQYPKHIPVPPAKRSWLKRHGESLVAFGSLAAAIGLGYLKINGYI